MKIKGGYLAHQTNPRVFHLLHRVHQSLFRAGNKLLTDTLGISTTQSAVLMFLKQNDGAAMGDLADGVGLKITSASGLIDRMEKAALVVRRRSDIDRRSIQIELTDQGRAMLKKAEPLIQQANNSVLAQIGERYDVTAFAAACETIISEAERLYSAPPATNEDSPSCKKIT